MDKYGGGVCGGGDMSEVCNRRETNNKVEVRTDGQKI